MVALLDAGSRWRRSCRSAGQPAAAVAAPVAADAPRPAPPQQQVDGHNRDVSLINQTGEVIMYMQWSNSNETSWGDDRLGADVIANGQSWFVTIDDGTGSCNFDFQATTASGRAVQRQVNVCQVSEIYFN